MVPPTIFKTLPQTERFTVKPWMHFCNKVLTKLHSPIELFHRFDYREDMVSLEQIANFELLITDILENEIRGDFVELGCYTGNTAVVFAKMLTNMDPTRRLHVFDRFDIQLGRSNGIREIFHENMRRAQVTSPIIHEGDLFETLPDGLPDLIAFAHIDLGTGGGKESHAKLIEHSLQHLYPRLVRRGVIVFMDYHDPKFTVKGFDANPGAKVAVDRFFEDKPEKIRLLFGGACSHAYMRKR